MKIETKLIECAGSLFRNLFGKDIASELFSLQKTRKEFEGDITIVAFPLAKYSGKNPQETAELLGSALKENMAEIASYNVVKGFLNISFTDQWWLKFFEATVAEKKYGESKPEVVQQIMIEYPSPNTNKPLHLGHLRNIFLGSAISGILKARGHRVIHTCLYNDRGTNISKSMLAWQRWGNGETPESSKLKGDHLAGKYYVRYSNEYKAELNALMQGGMTQEQAEKASELNQAVNDMTVRWENNDPEVRALWKKMNGWVYEGFAETYRHLQIKPDKFYYESDVYKLGKETVDEGLKKGVFFRKDDGSVWIDLTNEGLDEKLVLRSNGTTVYITQDIAVANEKERDFRIDQSIYVVGNEQEYHFKVLFHILRKLGRTYADNLYHLSYGMVELPGGKMKSREGTVVDADDLISEMIEKSKSIAAERGNVAGMNDEELNELSDTVGMGALRYYILKVDPLKRMIFNPEESIDLNGHTGPFIQYTHARISSLLRKAAEQNFTAGRMSLNEIELSAAEKTLLRLIRNYPEVLAEAERAFDPSHLANYLFELAKEYNHFYQSSPPILKEENLEYRQFRLEISMVSARTIKHGMQLLGIKVPERM